MKQKVNQFRIFITDSEDVYRKGIRWALSEIELFEVIGEATTNIETLERMVKTPADLLIMNTNHNKPSGIDLTRYFSHKLPDIKVILMMGEYNTEYVVRAMKSGAKTCVSKSIDLDSLLLTVSQVMHDELPISHYLLKPKVADYILKEYEVSNRYTNGTDQSHIKFVQSEVMILNKIKDDASLNNIATRLGISEEIIADYLDEIAEKLVRIDYYNESLEEKYINNLISSPLRETTGEQNSVRLDVEERERTKINKQSTELDEPAKDISEVIEMARKAGQLSSIHEFNQYIMNVTEGLMVEIDRRQRILRRLKKAIEIETALVKDSGITWN